MNITIDHQTYHVSNEDELRQFIMVMTWFRRSWIVNLFKL